MAVARRLKIRTMSTRLTTATMKAKVTTWYLKLLIKCHKTAKSKLNMLFQIISISGPKGQYLQKQTLLMTFGSRGSQPGLFTWPRGIAVGPDNSIVVADSSNHRVQVMTINILNIQ